MSIQISNAFIQAFSAEVHMLYQQEMALLRQCVDLSPNSPNLVGTSDRVQRLGLGNMTSKGRHAPIPSMNLDHDYVDIPVEDFYALEWLDELDEQKTNVNWRMRYARAFAMAAGRKTDDVIITALDSTTSTGVPVNFGGPVSGLTKAKIVRAASLLNQREVPQMERYFVIGPEEFADMFSISEFGNGFFVQTKPYQDGQVPQQFLGFNWILSNRLPISGTTRTCFAFQRSAINLAVGKELSIDVFWDGERRSWGTSAAMSIGSELIQDEGVVEVLCDES